ncbi:MAG: hypothetical protein IK041_08770, partial [Bacteroidales bacterium]|nr:hypothetical protein [Bacteroidales bacterium]
VFFGCNIAFSFILLIFNDLGCNGTSRWGAKVKQISESANFFAKIFIHFGQIFLIAKAPNLSDL